jgi:hypothetical protein
MFWHTNLFLWLLLPQFWCTNQLSILQGVNVVLPVNEKYSHATPDFDHMQCCMQLLSLTFSFSSELTLCSPYEKIFIFISLSLLCSLSEISLYSFFCNSSFKTPHHSHLLAKTCHNVYSQYLKSRTSRNQQPSCHTRN